MSNNFMFYSKNSTIGMNSERNSLQICQCDEDCIIYGDCCFDMAKSNMKDKASTFHNKWDCRTFTPNVSIILFVITTYIFIQNIHGNIQSPKFTRNMFI